MENLKKLLKVVEETKEKREEEYVSKCVQQLEKNGRLFDSFKSSEMFELGKLQGRIEEKTELAAALERMIKRNEEQEKTNKQALKTFYKYCREKELDKADRFHKMYAELYNVLCPLKITNYNLNQEKAQSENQVKSMEIVCITDDETILSLLSLLEIL